MDMGMGMGMDMGMDMDMDMDVDVDMDMDMDMDMDVDVDSVGGVGAGARGGVRGGVRGGSGPTLVALLVAPPRLASDFSFELKATATRMPTGALNGTRILGLSGRVSFASRSPKASSMMGCSTGATRHAPTPQQHSRR